MKTKIVSKVSIREPADFGPLRRRVIEAARELFIGRGLVRVTSDDLARDLGISKATLYKAFPSKEAIMRAVVRGMLNDVLAGVEALISDRSLGFVEKMVALFSYLAGRISEFGPLVVRDLQRNFPDIWREIDEFRREKIYRNFKVILESGRREGFFREDVDLDLLLQMFVILIQEFVNPTAILRSGRAPAATFESVIKVFFQGILTDKGRQDFSIRTPGLFEPRKEGAS